MNTATLFLFESAKNWRKSERNITPTTTPVTWELFKEKFKNNFLSHDFQMLKRQEFLSLKQGDMSAVDYEPEFQILIEYLSWI